ncbi:MAG: hypothetical protein NTX20_05200 [Verrucomicrobia bacterium]|nr:hypothetical protein [Verrucomicrobiota bacterium]
MSVRWVILLGGLSLSAQPRGVEEGFAQLSATEAAKTLSDFRRSGLSSDVCFKFEIVHKPRKGDSAPAVRGILWAAHTAEGSKVRVEMRKENGSLDQAFIAIKSPTNSALWQAPAGQAAQLVPMGSSTAPLATGLLLTPFDLHLPFTHWSDTQYTKTDHARGRPVHFFVAKNPAPSEPSSVVFGLDRSYGVLVQAVSLNGQNKITRTLQVEEFAKTDHQWILGACSVRDESTRDVDLLKITEAAVHLALPATLFDPTTLNQAAVAPANLQAL